MKRLFFLWIILLTLLPVIAKAETASEQYQRDLVDRLMYLRGQGARPLSLQEAGETPHCGTTLMFEASLNYRYLSDPYRSLARQLFGRPPLPDSSVSPRNHFRIHYTTTGPDSVYQPHVDLGDGRGGGPNGIPDYIDSVALIADSVYVFEVEHLGYMAPPSDEFYPAGGDSLYDIYVVNLGGGYYGATTRDEAIDGDPQRWTSFIELENDFSEL
ncbi:MAG: hypothetical protein NTV06_03395, partial [candidate division Zixibacteria bacterium]|nr:hypothetical protein [candidate division Zixibacteria bacterium]